MNSDVTSASKLASSGGFVTCAKSCLKYAYSNCGLSDKHASGVSVPIDPSASTPVTAIGATSGTYTVPGTPGTELTATANASIDLLSTALASIGTVRSSLGASANRLEHVYNNLSNISTNSKAATGRIMDVDFASESSKMTTNQMLLQAGTAMLKQSNSMSSMVMSLLQ